MDALYAMKLTWLSAGSSHSKQQIQTAEKTEGDLVAIEMRWTVAYISYSELEPWASFSKIRTKNLEICFRSCYWKSEFFSRYHLSISKIEDNLRAVGFLEIFKVFEKWDAENPWEELSLR